MRLFKSFLVLVVSSLLLVGLIGCNVKDNPDDGHEHSFGDWKVTTEPTCTEKGIETRTCSGCGDSETRDVAAIGHDFHHVEIVPASLKELGVADHSVCSRCGKLFNSKGVEVTLDSLKFAGVTAKLTSDVVKAKLNEAGDVKVFDGTTPVDKSDVDGFLFGINAAGKIIYASYFGGAGYGGPADGFYHDGKYALEPGKICGIFKLDEKFAGWPATAVVNGEEVSAWTLYDVVVPEGGYLICIQRGAADDFIQAITGKDDFKEQTDNTLFEQDIADGALNDVTISVELGDKEATFVTYKEADLTAVLNAEGSVKVYNDKATITKADIDDQYVIGIKDGIIIYASRFGGAGYGGPADGFYHDGSYSLEPGKVCGIFKLDEKFAGWPATAVVNGEEVSAWTLFDVVVPEGGYIIAGSRDAMADFIAGFTGSEAIRTEENNALFESIPDGKFNETLELEIIEGVSEAAVYANDYTNGLEFSGSLAGMFTLGEDGKYHANVEFTGEWSNMIFTWHGAKGATEVLWYDNTTFTGDVTAADAIGADWTANFYHEDTVGKFYVWKPNRYRLTYDRATKILDIKLVVASDPLLTVNGSVEKSVKADADGKFRMEFSLGLYNSIALNYIDKFGDATVLWYDNTTFTGVVTAEDKIGADWTVKLYHEEDKVLYCGVSTNPTYMLTYDPVAKTLNFEVKLSVSYSGSVSGSFESRGNDEYVAVVELGLWNNIAFTLMDENGAESVIWYDNTTFTGKVTAADKDGDAWDGSLYHEGTDKKFFCGVTDGKTYKLTYNAKDKTMRVAFYQEPALTYGGSTSGTFKKNEAGLLEAIVSLKLWNNVNFTYTDDEGVESVLWYDNTTFTGKVTAADKDGDAWDGSLYHEGTDKKFYCGVADGQNYKITFNPKTMVLNVEIYTEPLEVDGYFVIGEKKVAFDDSITIYNDESDNIKLGEYTVAIKADGTVFFASRTSSGYGGPSDGFYHDGSFAVVPGQVCGIYELDPQFAVWSEHKKVIIEGNEVDAYTLYKVVCPEGCQIITGSQVAMTGLVKALTGVETFNETGNTLFENTIEDGSLTAKIVIELVEA